MKQINIGQLSKAKKGDFFDKHATSIIFIANLGIPLSFLFSDSTSGITSVLQTIVFIVSVSSFILGLINFRGKRKEIFLGLGYTFLVIVVTAIVGFGVCMWVLSNWNR
jgi:VIT1/CCC1 family predicted Fe2+/Mn2+ transporter